MKTVKKFRRCSICKTVKDVSHFGKDIANPGGLQGICRMCVAIRDKERRSVQLTRCLCCGQNKPRTEFQKDKKICNVCRSSNLQTCSICGLNQPLNEFTERNMKHASGRSKRCRTCLANKQRHWNITPRGRYMSMRSVSRRRNHVCTIDFETYAELISQRCHYCGESMNATGCGLDRLDTTGGYTIANVVPCCRQCNWTKSDYFTYDEMLIVGEAIGRVKRQRAVHLNEPTEVA